VTVSADPDTIREAAKEILARPEFGDHRSVIERAVDWIGGLLSDIFGRLAGGVGSGAGFLGPLIQLSVVVGAAVVIALVVRSIIRALGSRHPKTPSEGLVVVFGETVDPSRLAQQANEAEAQRHWKQAALARYRHLVASLILAGVLADVPGRTTGEYRAEFGASSPGTAADFDQATAMFERAYYGDAAVNSDDYSEMRRLTSSLLIADAVVESGGGAS